MGIPGFASRLQDQGETNTIGVIEESLSPKLAVIDGPALAHFLYRELESLQAGSNVLQSSLDHSAIGKSAIEWLSRLQRFGFQVEGIFFDGALPVYKLNTRIERLERSLTTLIRYKHVTKSYGSANRNSKSGARSEPSTARDVRAMEALQSRLAPPPLLVPAIIEGLKDSSFREQVHVVNGEADSFCVAAALHTERSSPDAIVTIFTNDSDLLIYRSSENTRVVFINSIYDTIGENLSGQLRGLEFWPSKIARDAHPSLHDLIKPAFIMRDASITFKQACVDPEIAERSDEYLAFCAEYSTDRSEQELDRIRQGSASSRSGSLVDPRTSEIIFAAIEMSNRQFSTKHEIPKSFGDDDSAAELNLFLPILFEDPSRSSAWKIGQVSRNLAVSLLLSKLCVTPPVLEYKRSGTSIRPSQIANTSGRALQNDLRKWVEYLEYAFSRMPDLPTKNHRWLYLTVQVVFGELAAQGGQSPETPDVLAVIGNSESSSWAGVHFSAQLEAEYYSMRMLNQVLLFIENDATDCVSSDEEKKLRRLMRGYPPPVAFYGRGRISTDLDWGDLLKKMFDDESS